VIISIITNLVTVSWSAGTHVFHIDKTVCWTTGFHFPVRSRLLLALPLRQDRNPTSLAVGTGRFFPGAKSFAA
jgi:hypothetical protein